MKDKFPLPHVVDCDTKMVSILCDSAITAMGIKAIMNRFYPGYNARIVSKQFFETLNNKKQI
jgi:hypothetical protein